MYDPSTGLITIPLSDYITVGIVAIGMSLSTLLFFCLSIRMRNIVDRYRLKYGFDREIESKEIGNIKYLDAREKAFKRRVFKD